MYGRFTTEMHCQILGAVLVGIFVWDFGIVQGTLAPEPAVFLLQVMDYHPGYSLYFILFYFFGGLVPLRMLVGAIVDHFKTSDMTGQMMSEKQQEWVMNRKLLQYSEVCLDPKPNPPTDRVFLTGRILVPDCGD